MRSDSVLQSDLTCGSKRKDCPLSWAVLVEKPLIIGWFGTYPKGCDPFRKVGLGSGVLPVLGGKVVESPVCGCRIWLAELSKIQYAAE